MREDWSSLFPIDVADAEVAVVLTDWKGRIEWANPAFLRLTEYTLDEIRGCKPGPLLQGKGTDPRVIEAMHDAMTLGVEIAVTVRNYTKGGKPYDVALAISPLHDDQGAVRHFVSVGSEVTGASPTVCQATQARILSRLAEVLLLYQTTPEPA
ncbi:MAG: PAS domain-containing protein [Verrucomicrobiota bacterium]